MSAHKHYRDRGADHVRNCFVGICPACGERVLWDDPDGPVWTCPRDLSDANPYKDHDAPYSEADMARDGVYSQCGEDHGASCNDRLPLHSACYERGNY